MSVVLFWFYELEETFHLMIYNMFIESLYHPVKNDKKKKISFGASQNSNRTASREGKQF